MTRPSKVATDHSSAKEEPSAAAEAVAAPSSGLFNPALAAAPLLMAQDMALGAIDCWRVGLVAMRVAQDEMQRAWRQQSDAALQAWAEATHGVFEIAPAHKPEQTPADTPPPANDPGRPEAARHSPTQLWLNGAQAMHPFAMQVSAPWWSLMLDHDRRPQA
jgi:hypothetical protein